MRAIRDTKGSELRVERSADGHALTVQATLSTTRILDRRGVRALLDIIASSSEFRREMHNALAIYDGGLSRPARSMRAALAQLSRREGSSENGAVAAKAVPDQPPTATDREQPPRVLQLVQGFLLFEACTFGGTRGQPFELVHAKQKCKVHK